MPVKPANEDTKTIILEILENFFPVDEHWNEPSVNKLYTEACSKFGLNHLPPESFGAKLNENPAVLMRNKEQFLLLEPTADKKILPFVTIDSSDDWVHFRIYVFLTGFDDNSEIWGVLFRYETDEGDGTPGDDVGKHDFCHAQICRALRKGGRQLTSCWVPDSDPAIPLDADNQIGLVLCMLTSIYGGRCMSRRSYPNGKKVWEHMKDIRAFRTLQTT